MATTTQGSTSSPSLPLRQPVQRRPLLGHELALGAADDVGPGCAEVVGVDLDAGARLLELHLGEVQAHQRRDRRKDSDYSTRLKEKQRLRAQYDISETQLRAAFDRARRSGGKTGEALIQDLESRLDATVLRAGFARTIYQARQFVTHQHVLVNGTRVDRPSYRLKAGDFVQIAPKSRSKEPFQVAASGAHAEAPKYLEVRLADLVARYERTPGRDEVPVVCEEQLVVEYYSR